MMSVASGAGVALVLESLTFCFSSGFLSGFFSPVFWAETAREKKMADKAATMCKTRNLTFI